MNNRLKVLRAERNWSQAELGARLEVSRQAVNAIETGKHDPSLPLAFRIARYDGVRNGILAGVWTLVLGAILGGLGAWLGSEYNVFANVNLPNWFSADTRTIGAIVSGIVAVIAMFVGAALAWFGLRWRDSR